MDQEKDRQCHLKLDANLFLLVTIISGVLSIGYFWHWLDDVGVLYTYTGYSILAGVVIIHIMIFLVGLGYRRAVNDSDLD